MSPSELVSIVGSVCPKFDINYISATDTANVRCARGYKARIINKLQQTLPPDFKYTVTENYNPSSPVGSFYVDGVLSQPGITSVR